MTLLLVRDTHILGVDPTEEPDAYVFADLIIPKHTAPGAELVSVDALPEGYRPGGWRWEASAFVEAVMEL